MTLCKIIFSNIFYNISFTYNNFQKACILQEAIYKALQLTYKKVRLECQINKLVVIPILKI
jgi:hypothetical protein